MQVLAVVGTKTAPSGGCSSALQNSGEEQPVARINCSNNGSPLPKAALLQASLPMHGNAVRRVPITWQETTMVPLQSMFSPACPIPRNRNAREDCYPGNSSNTQSTQGDIIKASERRRQRNLSWQAAKQTADWTHFTWSGQMKTGCT